MRRRRPPRVPASVNRHFPLAVRTTMASTREGPRGMFLDGQELTTGEREHRTLLDPATGRPLATVSEGTRDDARAAVESALRAFETSGWPAPDGQRRGQVLGRIAQTLAQRWEEFARLETLNQGKPLRESKGDVLYAARTLEYYAGLADKVQGETIPVPGDRLDYTLREPLGVTVHIAPWNYPLQLAVRSLAPALAAGNAAVLKPASWTPLTALAFAKLATESGLPPGLLNVVPGPGREVGEALVTDRRVASVSFTGSPAVGRRIGELAASRVVPVTLELGGKGPNIVFSDADLERAARGVSFGIFLNAGQMCWAGSRLLVQEEVKERLLARVKELALKLKLGPGLEPGVEMGPLVTREHRAVVEGYVAKGVEEGAVPLVGGPGAAVPAGLEEGSFLPPTIFDAVSPGMTVAREEIFGPVLCALSFRTPDEALALANDSDYGLLAGVWTRDLSVAHRMARGLQAGMVSVNEYPVTFPQTPFGGYKQSGLGFEQGARALEFYTRQKNVNVNFSPPRRPGA
jgi:aldehyde dehydrogenase (NAD+)